MELTIFSKKRTSGDGKKFYAYLTTLTKKDGSTLAVAVKFRDECGAPKPENCPVIINVAKSDANLTSKDFTREDTGEPGKSYTLWVTRWTMSEKKYVDKSLDEFI